MNPGGIQWKAACAAVMFFGAVMLAPMQARAAEPPNAALNIVTSPLPVSLVAKPGTTVSTDLKVKNGGAAPEKLKVSLLKFQAFGEEGKPRLLDPEPGDDYFKWVKFSQNTFDAEPNVWKTIKMTITVPKSAAFGYYYAAVFSRATPEEVTGERQNAISGATATLVLLEARVPNAKRTVDVTEFSSKRKMYEFLPASFHIRLRNTGNVHVAPRGNIFITQGKRSIGTIEVNSEQGNILPGSFRQFDAEWNDGFPAYVDKMENGKVVINKKSEHVKQLKWDLQNIAKFRFGKFTADMLLVYDDGTRDIPVEAAVQFWVIPWRGLLVLLLLFGLVGFGIYMAMRGAITGVRQRRKS